MRSNAFTRLFGNSPVSRVIDLLLEGREFDYSISDIAEATSLHRMTVKKILENSIKEGLVIATRKMGKSQLYKINLNSEKVKKLFELYQVVLKEQEQMAGITEQAKNNFLSVA